MDENTLPPFNLPAVARKKVSAAFDGGRITSDGGVMLLAQTERRLGIAEWLAQGNSGLARSGPGFSLVDPILGQAWAAGCSVGLSILDAALARLSPHLDFHF